MLKGLNGIFTCIPAPSLTWILHRQLRLFGYGSGKPGDNMVPRRSVRFPLQGTEGKTEMTYFSVAFINQVAKGNDELFENVCTSSHRVFK